MFVHSRHIVVFPIKSLYSRNKSPVDTRTWLACEYEIVLRGVNKGSGGVGYLPRQYWRCLLIDISPVVFNKIDIRRII